MSGSVIAAIVFGVLLAAVGFVHPIGPALMFAAETPFDPMPFALFGTIGNIVTVVPIVIFLIKVNPASWGQIFLGTRIQQLLALFIVALLVSHAQGIVDKGIGEIIDWLRKLSLFATLAIFAFAMGQTRYLPLLVKTMVASMAMLTFLAMLDFHLGIQVLPVKAGLLETAALDTEFVSHLGTKWRFTGPGLPVNRFSNYLLLAIFLGVGWFMYVKGPIQRTIALGCTSLLVLGELLTITRSALLGLAIGMLILLPMALRFRVPQLLGMVVVGSMVGALAWYGVSLTSADEVLAQRFDVGHVAAATGGRLDRMFAALKIWSEHPFLGVGWGYFQDYSTALLAGGGGKGAHNGYLRVLAEAGLLGFIPMMMVTFSVLKRSLTRVGHLSEELEFWRPYFFCGLVAQLVTNVFNDYFWERYLWTSFAFVVALEHCYHAARAKEARARLERNRDIGARTPETFPDRVQVP